MLGFLRIWGVAMATDLGIGPPNQGKYEFSDRAHVIFSRSVFFLKKILAGDEGFWQGTRVSGRGRGFLAGDEGFCHAKTHQNAYKTNKNAYKTAGNAYKTTENEYKRI